MRISQAVAQLLRPLSRTVQARTFDGGVEVRRCMRSRLTHPLHYRSLWHFI
jgi:hypothetical protein